MNEQIKELILQAGFEPHYEPDGTFSYSEQFEKFAELIVAECGHYMVDIMLFSGIEPEQGYDIMLKHFGVEP